MEVDREDTKVCGVDEDTVRNGQGSRGKIRVADLTRVKVMIKKQTRVLSNTFVYHSVSIF